MSNYQEDLAKAKKNMKWIFDKKEYILILQDTTFRNLHEVIKKIFLHKKPYYAYWTEPVLYLDRDNCFKEIRLKLIKNEFVFAELDNKEDNKI